MKKVIKQSGMIPAYYGIAWVKYQSLEFVCYPVGINLLVVFAMRVKAFVKNGGYAVYMSPKDAYNQGYRDGRESK